MAYSNYTAQTWVDGSASTPISAARLGVEETGIYNAHFMPAVRVYNSGAVATSASTPTAIPFNTERFDQAGGAASTQHDNSTNNTRLTARYDGVYLIFGAIEFATSSVGVREVIIRLNGTTEIGTDLRDAAGSGTTLVTVSTIYALATNEYVELLVYQSTAGNLNVLATGNRSPEFGMVRVA